jgi:aryl-alcohol dehydrogenase-like predicted oxidoreductase
MNMTANINVERATIAGTSLAVSRVGLGTWAIGGWMWGGTDDTESVATIHAAIERGVNLIDTAPAYGFGRSEEIVGCALADGRLRSRVVIATRTGLEWRDGKASAMQAATASCVRLRIRCGDCRLTT